MVELACIDHLYLLSHPSTCQASGSWLPSVSAPSRDQEAAQRRMAVNLPPPFRHPAPGTDCPRVKVCNLGGGRKILLSPCYISAYIERLPIIPPVWYSSVLSRAPLMCSPPHSSYHLFCRVMMNGLQMSPVCEPLRKSESWKAC